MPWNSESRKKSTQPEYEVWGNKEVNMHNSISSQAVDVCWAGTSLQLPILRALPQNGGRLMGALMVSVVMERGNTCAREEWVCFFSAPAFCGVVKRGTGLSCGLRKMTLNVKNRSDSGDDERHTVCLLQKFWKVLVRMRMKCVTESK